MDQGGDKITEQIGFVLDFTVLQLMSRSKHIIL